MPESSPPNPTQARGLQVFGGLLLAAGVVVLLLGTSWASRAGASQGWPTAPGKVVRSEVRTSRGPDGRTLHGAQVEYRFQVEGRALRGQGVKVGDHASGDPAHAREVVARYPVGKEVTVHYDPADPERAVLEVGGTAMLVVPFVLGLGLAGMGGLLLLLGAAASLPPGEQEDPAS